MSILTRWFRHKAAPPAPETAPPVQPTEEPIHDDRERLTNAPYFLPKDAEEDERLFLQHKALYAAMSNHYLAPIQSTIQNALDVGCGTGIWVHDMSHLFPHTHFVGLDLSASSFRYPSNAQATFLLANVLDGLPFPDGQFDFVHQRLLVAGIPSTHWSQVIQELVRVTRPGGWVESVEVGVTVKNAGPETARLLEWMANRSQERGFDMALVSHVGDLLKRAGLQDVETQSIPVPLGAWAGHVGVMLKTDVLRAFDALKGAYCTQAQIRPEQFDAWVQAVAEEWEQRHASYVFHVTYGRRGQR